MQNNELVQKRKDVERLKATFKLDAGQAHSKEQRIFNSWQRSAQADIPQDRHAAPIVKLVEKVTSLDRAMNLCGGEISDFVEHSGMVVAVADYTSTIRWVESSSHMRSAAEDVHFIAGGQWREEFVGTNALALSLRSGHSSCVFSNEHFMPSVQDWVCYAAPIHDPCTQQIIGVIDLSTTWKKHNSLGVLAAERCAAIIQHALAQVQQPQLTLKCFGAIQVYFQGKSIAVTPRQLEILTILSLCKQGMSLEQLHQALYGERKVSTGTLKAEISQLRDLFPNVFTSRPYRLSVDIQADFLQLEDALAMDCIDSALKSYTGMFLPKTESPFLTAWRDCIESRLSESIFKVKDTEILLKHIAYCPDALDAVERLMELIPSQHPIHQLIGRYQET